MTTIYQCYKRYAHDLADWLISSIDEGRIDYRQAQYIFDTNKELEAYETVASEDSEPCLKKIIEHKQYFSSLLEIAEIEDEKNQ